SEGFKEAFVRSELPLVDPTRAIDVKQESSILMVGWYPELMFTRTAILRAKGYAVTEVHDPADALRLLSVTDPALVIVCHSIPRKLRRAIVSEMKHARPLVPVLVFGSGIL